MAVRVHPVLVVLAASLAAATACDGDSPPAGDQDEASGTDTPDPTTASAASTGEEPPTFPQARECSDTADCEPGESCVATYDPGRHVAEIGRCVAGCIAPHDEVRWCIDSASCCADLRCDPVQGFCHPASLP